MLIMLMFLIGILIVASIIGVVIIVGIGIGNDVNVKVNEEYMIEHLKKELI